MNEIPIRPVEPDELIARSLQNQIIKRLNEQRQMRGGDDIAVSQFGGGSLADDQRVPARSDMDWLVYVDVDGTKALATPMTKGLYLGRMYYNLPLQVDPSAADLTIAAANPAATTCVVINLSEIKGVGGSPISANAYLVGHIIGQQQTGLPLVAVGSVGGGGVAFLVTSTTSTVGIYNVKTSKPGTATATTPATSASAEDAIFINGAEYGIVSTSMLLASPNAGGWGVRGSGVITGKDAATGKPIIEGWMGFLGCGPAFYSGPAAGATAVVGGVVTS